MASADMLRTWKRTGSALTNYYGAGGERVVFRKLREHGLPSEYRSRRFRPTVKQTLSVDCVPPVFAAPTCCPSHPAIRFLTILASLRGLSTWSSASVGTSMKSLPSFCPPKPYTVPPRIFEHSIQMACCCSTNPSHRPSSSTLTRNTIRRFTWIACLLDQRNSLRFSADATCEAPFA